MADFADPHSRLYPIKTPDEIRATWAVFWARRAVYTATFAKTIETRIRRAAEDHGIDLELTSTS